MGPIEKQMATELPHLHKKLKPVADQGQWGRESVFEAGMEAYSEGVAAGRAEQVKAADDAELNDILKTFPL